MIRKVLGVIVGYVAMAAFLFAMFSIAYIILGTEGSFKPGSFDVSGIWIVISIVLGLVGAILGGWVCVTISRDKKAAMVLAGFVLVLGIAMAVATLSDSETRTMVRTGEVAMMDAMQSAHQPSWLAFLNPLLGAVGVMFGSCMKKEDVAKA